MEGAGGFYNQLAGLFAIPAYYWEKKKTNQKIEVYFAECMQYTMPTALQKKHRRKSILLRHECCDQHATREAELRVRWIAKQGEG